MTGDEFQYVLDESNGYPVALEEDGIAHWKQAPPIVPARKHEVRAEG